MAASHSSYSRGVQPSRSTALWRFEEPVEVGAAECTVVGVADEAGEGRGCLEVLVDDEVSFGWS